MTISEQILGQVRNTTGGTAESIYSPGSGETGVIRTIVVCNTTMSADSFSIFLDNDGTTYDESTALYFDEGIAANETIVISVYLPMNNSSGNLAVECATTNAVTFTVAGLVIS